MGYASSPLLGPSGSCHALDKWTPRGRAERFDVFSLSLTAATVFLISTFASGRGSSIYRRGCRSSEERSFIVGSGILGNASNHCSFSSSVIVCRHARRPHAFPSLYTSLPARRRHGVSYDPAVGVRCYRAHAYGKIQAKRHGELPLTTKPMVERRKQLHTCGHAVSLLRQE